MHSEQIAIILTAATSEATRIAEKPVTLVSATFEWMAAMNAGETATPRIEITRATRTLVFSTARLHGADGRLLMTASVVHRI